MASGTRKFLRVINEPEAPSSGSLPCTDLVFVHGLNPQSKDGFAYSTWTHSNGNFWPGDQMRQAFPNVRTLLFSYNSRVGSDVSTNSIKRHADDLLALLNGKRMETGKAYGPIIFVAHSMGGLVVKQALVTAKINDRFKNIRESTKGLVFFAVPHQGGHGASLGKIAHRVVTSLTGEARNDLIESLEKNSLFQEHQASDFKHQLGDYRVLTIVEDRNTKFVKSKLLNLATSKIVVDEKSATLGLPGERELIITVDSDHSEVCKFRGDDDKFEPIKNALQELINQTQPDPIAMPGISEAIHNLPFPRNPRFVGRQAQLDSCHSQLIGDGTFHKAAIYGLGGAGKTSVALEFAYQVQEHRPACSIFWVPAHSKETFVRAMEQIIRLLNIPITDDTRSQKLQILKEHLSQKSSGEWLLVLDNADNKGLVFESEIEENLTMAECLPHNPNGSMLFTTRTYEIAVGLLGHGNPIEVNQLDETAGHNLLKSLVKEDALSGDRDDRQTLLQQLSFLPLAITQAAAYISVKRVAIPKYYELFQKSESLANSLLSQGFYDSTRDRASEQAVATCWITSFHLIKIEDPLAAKYLSWMSLYESREIHACMLPDGETEFAKTNAFGTLLAYSLITHRGNGDVYDMHQLVHLVAETWTSEFCDISDTFGQILEHLEPLFSTNRIVDSFSTLAFFTPHVQKLIDECEKKDFQNDLLARWELCKSLGCWFTKNDQNSLAIHYLEHAYHGFFAKLDLASKARIRCVRRLSYAYQYDSQYDRAIDLLKSTFDAASITLEDDDEQLLRLRADLAAAYIDTNEVTKAIMLLEHNLKIDLSILPADHPERLTSQHDLAIAYRHTGKNIEAIALLEHVVDCQSRTLPKEHPNSLSAQSLLAKTYLDNNQIDKSIALLNHVLDLRSKSLREDHSFLLESQYWLARAYMKKGDFAAAIPLLEHFIAVKSKISTDGPELDEDREYLAKAREGLAIQQTATQDGTGRDANEQDTEAC